MTTLMDIMSGAGYVMDTPGALMRGLLSGRPGERASGQEMIQSWGGPDIGALGGMGVEMLADPLNMLGGAGILRKMLQARKIKKANAASEAMRASGAMPEELARATRAVDGAGNPLVVEDLGKPRYLYAENPFENAKWYPNDEAQDILDRALEGKEFIDYLPQKQPFGPADQVAHLADRMAAGKEMGLIGDNPRNPFASLGPSEIRNLRQSPDEMMIQELAHGLRAEGVDIGDLYRPDIAVDIPLSNLFADKNYIPSELMRPGEVQGEGIMRFIQNVGEPPHGVLDELFDAAIETHGGESFGQIYSHPARFFNPEVAPALRDIPRHSRSLIAALLGHNIAKPMRPRQSQPSGIPLLDALSGQEAEEQWL
jgi:hypothetical protein